MTVRSRAQAAAELAGGIPRGEAGCSDTAGLGAARGELTAQKAAARNGADGLITGGFGKDLSHPPMLLPGTKGLETELDPLALGGFGAGKSNSI